MPQRLRAARVARTRTTNWPLPRLPLSGSNATLSTTVFSTPNRARHTLALRTPFPVHRFLTLDKPET
jgi:hypothetical protein